jgi:hypothetical protein
LPATDGKLVFAIGPMGDLYAVNFSDGKQAWTAHLLRDWDAASPMWGVATSPLLLGDLVVVSPWGAKASLVQKGVKFAASAAPAGSARPRIAYMEAESTLGTRIHLSRIQS